MGPVGFQKWSESWKVPIDVKKAMYGDNIRPVGGRNPGDDGGDGDDDDNANDAATAAAASAEDEDDDKNRPNFQVETSSGKKKAEPAFWWALPEKYYKEMQEDFPTEGPRVMLGRTEWRQEDVNLAFRLR